MKILLFVVCALALLWLLRRGASGRPPPPPPRGPSTGSPSDEPQPMLACTQCGVHLPRDEALPGRGGVFCSEGHRTAYEQAHPGSR